MILHILMVLFRLIGWLPFWFLYPLSNVMAFLAEHIIKYRKKVVLENLQNSFPEKSPDEIRRIASEFYRNLTDVTLETFKLITLSEEEVNARITFRNVEMINDYYDRSLTVIATSSHLCNWEWMLAAGGLHFKAPLYFAYQHIQNPFFENLMIRIRSRFGPIPVERSQILRESIKNKDIPHVVALVADQAPPGNAQNLIWNGFLSQDSAFYSGMAKLAKLYNWPILFLEMTRIKRGIYELEFKEVCLEPEKLGEQEIIGAYSGLVEEAIRKNPSDWLWSHKRWKRKKPN